MYQNLSHYYRNFGFTIVSKLMFINHLVNNSNKDKEEYNLMTKKSFESLWKRYFLVSDDINTISL